jgi:phage terminase large subunit-like protein
LAVSLGIRAGKSRLRPRRRHAAHQGRWAAKHQRLILETWQVFVVTSLFGWVEKATGDYRFWEAYLAVPRKNGKSPLAAAIGHHKFAAEGEHGAEVYSGATSTPQGIAVPKSRCF